MKRLLLTVLLLVASVWSVEAATIRFALTNFNLTTPSNIITVIQTQPVNAGDRITVGNPIRLLPTTGVVTTNLAAGKYELRVQGLSWPTTLYFHVPDNSDSYDVAALITNGTYQATANLPFVTTVNATNSTASAGVVAVYPTAHKGNVVLSIGTNVAASAGAVVVAGTNVTVQTNGIAYTVSSTGSGGGANVTSSGTALTLTTNGSLVTIISTNLAHHTDELQYDQGQYYPLATVDTNTGSLYKTEDIWFNGTSWVVNGALQANLVGTLTNDISGTAASATTATTATSAATATYAASAGSATNVQSSAITWGNSGTNLWEWVDPDDSNIKFTIGGDGKISTNAIREAISGISGGGQYVAAGTNITAQTNGTTVTVNATVPTGWSLLDTNLGVNLYTNAINQFWLSSGIGLIAGNSVTITTNGNAFTINSTATSTNGGDVTAAQLASATNIVLQDATNRSWTAILSATNVVLQDATNRAKLYSESLTNGFAGTGYVDTATNGSYSSAVAYTLAATNTVLQDSTNRAKLYSESVTNGFAGTGYVTAATNGAYASAVAYALAATNGSYSSAVAYSLAATNTVLTDATNKAWTATIAATNTVLTDATNRAWTATVNATNVVLQDATNRAWVATQSATNTVLTDATNRAKAYADSVAGAGWSLVDTNLGVSIITNAGSQLYLASSAAVNWTGGQTNQGTTTPDMNKKWSGYTTAADFTVTGLSNVDTSGTNVQQTTMIITNTSGSTKVMTLPASWIKHDGVSCYVTNQGVLSIAVYPGLGTNAAYKCLK